jgi:murein DD-endopeptidase MepM/ murein hydrolase activator NlpD
MFIQDNSSAKRASLIKNKVISISLITTIFVSAAFAGIAAANPQNIALDVATSLPTRTITTVFQNNIEEAAEATISSVIGIVGLMKQAQEVSAMLPSRQNKSIPEPKTDMEVALEVALKLPNTPGAAKSISPTQKPEQAAQIPALTQPKGKIGLPGSQNLIWPVDGLIYSAFGASRGRRAHGAIDIVTKKGTPIAAAADGIVSVAANGGKKFSGYGKIVILDHGKGLYTVYAHCDSILVKMGQKVKQGEYIGTVGRTGRASTDHCHFEVRIAGKKHNPLAYLPSRPEIVKATNYQPSRKKKK